MQAPVSMAAPLVGRMAEDDQEWIEGDVRRSSFGSFGIRCQKRKRKSGDDEGGGGAPQGPALVRH